MSWVAKHLHPLAGVTTVAAALLVSLTTVTPASAYQNPAVTLAGPSNSVVALGDVAMSPDGKSGGVVDEQLLNGRTHIFVAPYRNGVWYPSQQVDAGQQFDSSFPQIGAGNNGRLVVTWVQNHGPDSDQLWAARMGVNSATFDPSFVIDTNIGQATYTDPSLAVSPDGTAYISYVVEPPVTNSFNQVVEQTPTANGEVSLEYHLAQIGDTSAIQYPPLNRREGVPDPIATPATAPKVAIDANDDAVVAWVEPDDVAIPRLWARRIYSDGVGSLEQISADPLDGKPMPAAVDGFSMAMAGNGNGAIAYEQAPIAGSVLPRQPRLLGARLFAPGPGVSASASSRFQAPAAADGLGPLGSTYSGTLGTPQVSVSNDGLVGVAYMLGNQIRLAGNGVLNAGAVTTNESGSSPFAMAIGTSGAGVLAWPDSAAGGSLAVQERTFTGRVQTGRASAEFPGPVLAIQAAGSTLGDGIVAFQQGSGDTAEIGAVVVDAPPAPFSINQPAGWLQRNDAAISWTSSPAAFAPVTYRLYIDGRLRKRTTDTTANIRQWVRQDGRHRITVIATDGRGQATVIASAVTVRVDGTPPSVSLKQGSPHTWVGRHTLSIKVTDKGAGLDKKRTSIDWGDGTVTSAAVRRHRYAHTGRYRVVVMAYDNVGNLHRRVQRVEVLG